MRSTWRAGLAAAASVVLVFAAAGVTSAESTAAPSPPTAAASAVPSSVGPAVLHFTPIRGSKGGHGHGPGGGGGGGTVNLLYNGGLVETSPSVYISYWGPEWTQGFSTGGYSSGQAQTYVNGYFNSVGGSNWINTTTQYCEGIATGATACNGGTLIQNPSGQLAGVWVDATSVPLHPSQSDIEAAALRLATQFGGVQPGATYFVLTPSGHSQRGFGTQWCAYHGSFSSSQGNVAFAYLPYQPDAGTSCGMNFVNATDNSFGNGYFDGFSVVGGHEYAEAQTDPFPTTGWLDSSGSEIGDKCAWSSLSANITLGSNYFAVQPLWSNASTGCVMSY